MDDGGCIRTLLTAIAPATQLADHAATAAKTTATQSGSSSLLLDIILILIFVLINAFFSGTEMAVINLNDNKIRKEAEDGSKVARKLLYFIENQGRFLATIQMGVTLAGFMSSALAGDKLSGRLAALIDPTGQNPYINSLSLVLITIVISFISLVLGELVPKQLAIHNPEKFSRAVAGLIRACSTIFYPFTKFLNFCTKLVLKIFGIDANVTKQAVTEDEIRMMLNASRESGNIHADESEMIENIFEFNDKEVSEIMTHRTNVTAIPVDAPFDVVVDTAVNERYSRIPVYEENIDDIVGVFHIKDLLIYLAQNDQQNFNLRTLLRPPYLTPESKHVDELFREMQNANVALAVVIDEYGGTSGIVTIEDLLEEIVGNIQDEYDEEQREVIRVADNVYMVEGLTSIDDLARYIPEIDLEEEHEEGDFDTVAGLVLDVLGRIPDEYEHPVVEYKNYVFQVLAMDDNRIAKLKLIIKPPAENDKENGKGNGRNGDKKHDD